MGFSCQIVPSHSAADFSGVDVIVLPGGFSYGDYLRSGAIAAKLPIMHDVRRAAKAGRYVLGICNGFQILTESRLLPGALRMNAGQLFVCRSVKLNVARNDSAFSHLYQPNANLDIPVAHHNGNYFADPDTLEQLEAEERVIFRYGDNPNGSMHDIAGIRNSADNVLGVMPHPENAALAHHQSQDGLKLFASLAARIGS